MTDKIAEQMARLEERQEWALHVARAGLVKCVEREESKMFLVHDSSSE